MEFLKTFSLIASSFMIFHSIVSRYVQKYLMISDPLIMMTFGVLIGTQGLNFLKSDYSFQKKIIGYYSRGLLCIQTMAISLSIPSEYFFKQKNSLFNLVVLGGFIKCMIIFVLFIGLSSLNIHTCWAIAASLTPTDPILCSSIQKNINGVPDILITLLTAESGINDCFGLIMLNVSLEIFGPLKKVKIANFPKSKIKSNIKNMNIKLNNYEKNMNTKLDNYIYNYCQNENYNRNNHSYYSLIGKNQFSRNNIFHNKTSDVFIKNSIYFLKLLCDFDFIDYTPINYIPQNTAYYTFNDKNVNAPSKYFKIIKIIYSYLLIIVSFLLSTIIIKLILSAVIGYVLGFVIREITTYVYSIESIRYEIVLFHAFALTLLGLCLADMFDGSELICIFGIGMALNKNSTYILDRSNKRLSEIIETLFANSFFILLGLMIQFHRMSWRIIGIAMICIILTRISSVFSVKKRIPQLDTNINALFVGWFGPIGVSSLYYCLIYDEKMSTRTFEIAVIVVFLSVIVHGLSTPVYTLYKKCRGI